MTAGICYINGRRISISAVSARSYTASKDTYVDVLDNQDGTGTLVYTEVANNAASPALASNSMRIGIVVTGASNIASVASINQGQTDKILPIASSIAYTVTDSIGNLICPRDPNRKMLGFRQVATTQTPITTEVDATGVSMNVIVPANRKVKLTAASNFSCSAAAGAVGTCTVKRSTTTIGFFYTVLTTNDLQENVMRSCFDQPSSGVQSYKLTFTKALGGGTMSNAAAASLPTFLLVELE